MDTKSLLVFLYCAMWYCEVYSDEVRLKPPNNDPTEYYYGTVIVRKDSNGSWGSICDDHWGMEDANVVCRMLGFPSAVSFHLQSEFGIKGSYPIVLDDLDCNGTESNLGDCKRRPWGEHNCSLTKQAGVTCRRVVKLVRLLPPSIQPELNYKGTVLVNTGLPNSQWGTICDDIWTMNEATVVCRMLGFSEAVNFHKRSSFGKVEYAIALTNVNCTGAEPDLASCRSDLWGRHNCGLDHNVGVECGANQVRLIPPSDEPLARNKGTVLIRSNATSPWSTVCSSNWNINYARVVCRMLGFINATIRNYTTIAGYPQFLYNLSCSEFYWNIIACKRNLYGLHNCTANDEAGVACGYMGNYEVRIEPYDVKIRHSGTVLVRNSSSSPWGTICDSYWDLRDANVICRMLGYPGAVEAHVGSKFGPLEALPFLLDNVDCIGEEASLGLCVSDKFGSSTCKKFPNAMRGGNAGVTCEMLTYNALMVHEANNGCYHSGAVLIQNNHTHRLSTICGDHWDILDADVFCRMLNFTNAVATYSWPASGVIGSLPMALDDFHCNGNESNLANCWSWRRFGSTDCSNRRLAGVTCYGEIRNQTSSSSYGHCYIQNNGTIACTCGYTSKDCSKDTALTTQLEFFAYYNVSCQLLDAESSIIRSVINSRFYNIEKILYGIATRAMNQSANMDCKNNVLSVTWPTSLTYTGGVTNLTADHYSYIASRIPRDSAFLDLFHPANTPAVLRAYRGTPNAMSHVTLRSHCTYGKAYSSTSDFCIAP